MKVRLAVVYKDPHGRDHICEPIGKRISLSCSQYQGWEENLLTELRKQTYDSTLIIENVRLSSCHDDENIILIDTGCNYYFAKRIDNTHFEAFISEDGFGFGNSSVTIAMANDGNYTVFCFRDRPTGKRYGGFYYLKW